MPNEPFAPTRARRIATALLLGLAAAIVVWMAYWTAAASGAPAAGPDLTVEISLDPPVPDPNQEVTVKVTAYNIGTSNANSQVQVLLFVDPVDRPPTTATGGGFPIITVPGLTTGGCPGGGCVEGSRSHTFTTEGCDHVVYAWIDRDNTIAEDNEDNNLVALPVCVGEAVQCQPDSFEADDTRQTAGWIVENTAQARSLCHDSNPNTPDTDWVKLTTFSGVTYTLALENLGPHANPALALDLSCGLTASAGPGEDLVWQAPVNGLCYVSVVQDPIQGPLSAYSLTLSSATGIVDMYEPDNRCADARDIATDGVAQTHLFQAPGDEDWVKFAVEAGDSFFIAADNTASGVNPQVTVFASCDQVPANNSLGPPGRQVAQSSPTAGVYFARVKNENAGNFGAGAHYDLSVTVSACIPDADEEDDSAAQAKSVTVGGAARRHNFCPAADEDWVQFNLEANKTYVLLTSNLEFASDTVLTLFAADGATQIAENDDYGYVSGSRIIYETTSAGTYLARIRHDNPAANGPNTAYDFSIQEGVCSPDDQEGEGGDNGPGDAALAATNGISRTHNFCADPLDPALGDQDWVALDMVAGGSYQIYTTGLGPNADTVVELYGSDGNTRLLANDDAGQGRGASLDYTATTPGRYYVRVTQYNGNVTGNDASYHLQVFATEPPTPTPTPTFTPTPTPTPPATATPSPSTAETLILVNRERLASLYGAAEAANVMEALFALADDTAVNGVVIQVESDPAVAAAYAAWTADLTDNALANDVVAAIRNRLMGFLSTAPAVKHVVIAGDDRVIPFRRVVDRVSPKGQSAASIEQNYAGDVVEDGAVRAALAANMVLTDDYLVDVEPSKWEDRQKNKYELYIADYAVGRLIETPAEIVAFINNFLAGDKQLDLMAGKALVTGYDFVRDGAEIIRTLFTNDTVVTDGVLIGPSWPGQQLRDKYLAASPRFDLYSVNGHSTHVAAGVPNEDDITADEIVLATADLSGALVFSLGCHGGLNDPGVLDLPQAYARKLANYVGNTGFGWGGGGVVYSEALMRNYTRELLRDASVEIGPALVAAKKKYYSQVKAFNAFDAKVMMQVTLYGLPMVAVTSGGTLSNEDPFPSADPVFTPPTAFGELAAGSAGYQLPGSFGAFGEETGKDGSTYNLDGNVVFSADEPLQPLYYTNVAAPAAGELRGAVFLGGVYSDTPNVDPVIALAENEYVTDKSEPGFVAENFHPALPFTVRSGASISGTEETLVLSLGQFRSAPAPGAAGAHQESGVVRVFDQMSFGTYYSDSPDRNAANIAFVDGVLDPVAGTGEIKVEATDSSGIHRVVVAYTAGQGQWQSKDLDLDEVTQKWTGEIPGSSTTLFFVQVVDNAGNVAVNENKGRYYALAPPPTLAEGRQVGSRIYLPVVTK